MITRAKQRFIYVVHLQAIAPLVLLFFTIFKAPKPTVSHPLEITVLSSKYQYIGTETTQVFL